MGRRFLARAEAAHPSVRDDFRDDFMDNIQAAIVFGRSMFHYLDRHPKTDPAYAAGFQATAARMTGDPVLAYFKDARDLWLKRRPPSITRRIYLSSTLTATGTVFAEARVKRAGPWYRRPPRILWMDTGDAIMRPIRRWRRQGAAAIRRRIDPLRRRVETWRARRRAQPPSVREYYFSDADPEGLDRPAVDLVREYLDRLEAIVDEAEAQFPALRAR